MSDFMHEEFLLFAVTPPREAVSADAAAEIAQAAIRRLESVKPDAVILYDIADESARTSAQRPFPYLPTMDPAVFWLKHFRDSPVPVIIYRSVGKYTEDQLRSWLLDQDVEQVRSVFVGAANGDTDVATSLARAYALRGEVRPDLAIGGVAIPERHVRRHDEHLKLVAKQESGCSFFITQVVFDSNAAKNLISDYRAECLGRDIPLIPIVFTFSVIGSLKTLNFMRWLGVEVPRWIENDVTNAETPLQTSHDDALAVATDLINYCRRTGLPFGINVESVSARRSEIDKAVELAAGIAGVLGR